MSSGFKSLQQEVVDRLEAQAAFANIDIVRQDIQDIASRINESLLAVGVGVVVFTPYANLNHANMEVWYDDCRITVRIIENPTTNSSTGALELAEEVTLSLHHFKPVGSQTMIAISPTIELVEDDTLLMYDVNFKCATSAGTKLTASADPDVNSVAGTVTITTNEAGAATWYTNDGSKPSPANGTLYTAPFAETPGVVIKARSFLASKHHSAIVSHTVV